MKVSVMTATNDPLEVISRAAGTCYGKDDPSPKRVENCYKSGHMGVFEHASVTFKVEGISRACSHQLVRHRLASFCQESQRYCEIDVESGDWFVMPPSFAEYGSRAEYINAMNRYGFNYKNAIRGGVKPEDARYMLPEATKTNITVTMNCRELFHFLDLRKSKAAQWEIRELASQMEAALLVEPDWEPLMKLRGGDSR